MSGSRAPRRLLESCFQGALDAVEPGTAVRRAMRRGDGRDGPLEIAGRALGAKDSVRVIAVGKAAPAMARAALDILGPRCAGGLVVARDGQGESVPGIETIECGHPLPDARAIGAVEAIRRQLAEATAEESSLVLLSGGASALLSAPLPGLELDDVIRCSELLLACGAPIHEINCLRKHLTALSGGRLAREAGPRFIDVLAISDVPGDSLEVIGSGPCAGDPTRYPDAIAILEAREIWDRVPVAVREHLQRGARGEAEESLDPADPALRRVSHRIVASNRDARMGARDAARAVGLASVDLGECLVGEARSIAPELIERARSLGGEEERILVAGGETTVRVTGSGIGGRSQELALAAALVLEDAPGIAVLAAGTDGSDGPTDAAGAYADPGTVNRGGGRARAEASLADNDAYSFFDAEGGLLRIGPTGTNVMDLVLLYVAPGPSGGLEGARDGAKRDESIG